MILPRSSSPCASRVSSRSASAALMGPALQAPRIADPGQPVAVLEAGPVRWAAADQLVERSLPFVDLESDKLAAAPQRGFSPSQCRLEPAPPVAPPALVPDVRRCR